MLQSLCQLMMASLRAISRFPFKPMGPQLPLQISSVFKHTFSLLHDPTFYQMHAYSTFQVLKCKLTQVRTFYLWRLWRLHKLDLKPRIEGIFSFTTQKKPGLEQEPKYMKKHVRKDVRKCTKNAKDGKNVKDLNDVNDVKKEQKEQKKELNDVKKGLKDVKKGLNEVKKELNDVKKAIEILEKEKHD